MSSLSLLFSLLIIFLPSSYGFNITKILDQQGDFSTFNSLLTQAQLAGDINSRRTITVLAVSDDNISPLSSQSKDVIKKILSLHVVLDYYDAQKLQKLQNKTTILTTLFQSSGQARGQQGFLNVTIMKNGDVAFGSAVPGSSLGANLVKSVVSQPYNISVLQISSVIMIDVKANAPATSPPAPPTGTPKKAPSPAKTPPAESPSDDDDASSPMADGPAGGAGSAADAPTGGKSSGVKTVSEVNLAASLMVIIISSAWWLLAFC